MAPRRRPPPSTWDWLRQLADVWPVVVFLGGLIAAVVAAEITLVSLQRQVLTITQRQDSSVRRAETRDYMTCHMFEILLSLKKDTTVMHLPKRCDDVFQSVGYR